MLPKQTYPYSLVYFFYSILIIGLFSFSSCNQKENKQTDKLITKTKTANNNISNSLVSPKITFITASNQPKIIKAGKPVIKIDSSNNGTPFFTSYTTDDGLPINVTTCCMQDKDGNLWIGTGGGGLVRYDGKNFTTFTTAQGLPDNYIEDVIQDTTGSIWISTISNGVSRYDGKTFTNYSTADGLAGNLVTTILQAKDGNMWFATEKGVSRYNGKVFTNLTTAQGLAGDNIKAMIQDKAGNLWFGCTGAGISRYDGKTFTNFTTGDGLPGKEIRSMMQDKDGNIWITTFGTGASRFNGKTFINYSTAQGLASNILNGVMQDKDGNIWFGISDYGISCYNGKTFINYNTSQGLTTNAIFNTMQDKDGSIWFCALNGLGQYNGQAVTYYNKLYGLAGNDVENIMQDKNGSLWFSCFGGGITAYDGKEFSGFTSAQGLINNYVLCSMQDKDGNIWIGTNNGISMYNGESFINYSSAQGLNLSVSSIIQDRSGNIWFGCNGSGVYKYDGKSFTNYTTQQGLCGNYVNCLMQAAKGDIWMGANNGVSRFNGRQFINYTTADGLTANSTNSIIQDKSGDIWLGSGAGGATRYINNHFIKYTTADGLANDAVTAIAEDSKRNIIWFGTNLGFSGLKKEIPANKNLPAFDIFNVNTGYPIKNLNGSALFVDDKGIVWAGCESERLIRFNYNAVNKNVQPLKLQIGNIEINEEKICWNNLAYKNKISTLTDSLALINEMVTTFGKILPGQLLDGMREKYSKVHFDSITPHYFIPVNLVLPYEDRNLAFNFVAIEPDKPKQVKYQYKLEGYNKDWSSQSNSTTATFGNIAEGSYTFHLKALSPYGVWSETSYTFKVLPPWYRTWWAYSIYALCFIAVLLLTGRMLQQRLIKKERAKSQLRELEMQALRAQMNPHFIFNCLSSINRFVLMNETEAASDYLTKFSKLIRTVLNNSKKSLITLEDELEMLKLYLDMERMRFQNSFEYNIYIDDNVEPQNIFIPPLLFQPFAENAVWHGLMHKEENGKLIIRLIVKNDVLNFEIEDNGIGRVAAASVKSKSAEQNKSLGLQITKERLSLINGYTNEETFFEIVDLYDENGKAAGTKVILKIKYSETPTN